MVDEKIDVLVANRFARDGCVVALGGGVVGDMSGFAAACYQGFHACLGQTFYLAETQANRMAGPNDISHFCVAGDDFRRIEPRRLKQTVPMRVIDIDGPDFNAMVLRIANQLRRLIETHWLGVQDRGAKDIGIEGFEPA